MALALRVDDGKHRQATWLELFFDLAFVACIGALSHRLVHDSSASGLAVYLAMFVAVWWIWNQFTWYASHFDNDDVYFRAFMLAGVGGTVALILGIKAVNTTWFVAAYIALHAVLFAGWWRALRHVSTYRPYIRLKLLGIALGIFTWSLSLCVGDPFAAILRSTGLTLQLLMPILAWMTIRNMISVHVHHLLERHGLFTIIVLGESLISLTHVHHVNIDVIVMMVAMFVTVAAIWWIYFDWGYDPLNLANVGRAFAYNYGQLLIYASLGIMAAGIELELDHMNAGIAFFIGATLLFLLVLALINLCSGLEGFTTRCKIKLAACLPLALLFAAAAAQALSPMILAISNALVAVAVATLSGRSRNRGVGK